MQRNIGILLICAFLALSAACQGAVAPWQTTISPGEYGVLITYEDPTQPPGFQPIAPGTRITVNPLNQVLARYPAGQQSLVMVQAESEGQVKGDDSTPCTLKDGTQVRVDSTTQWRVKPSGVGNLYLLHPNTPLTSKPNADLSSTLVRGIVIHAITVECGGFTYKEYTENEALRDKFNEETSVRIQAEFDKTYLNLDGFFTRPFHPNAALQEALNTAAKAEQDVRSANFAAQASKAKADQEAANISTINASLANAPEYTRYLEATRWDGKLPETLVVSNENSSQASGLGIILPQRTR